MKKRLTNLRVEKGVATRGSYKGQAYEYVVAELVNVGANWLAGNTTRKDQLFIMNPTLIGIFKDFICKKNGGNVDADVNPELPDEYKEIRNVFRVNVPLKAKYYRIYQVDERDEHGKVLHRKGEPVKNEAGDIMIYDTLNVLAFKYEDEDSGDMCWVDEPEAIARRIISRGGYKMVGEGVTAIVPGGQEMSASGSAEDDVVEAEEEKPLDEMSPEELKAKLKALNS